MDMENLHPKLRQRILNNLYDKYKKSGLIQVENIQELQALTDSDLYSVVSNELIEISKTYNLRKEGNDNKDEVSIALSILVFKLKLLLESNGVILDLRK